MTSPTSPSVRLVARAASAAALYVCVYAGASLPQTASAQTAPAATVTTTAATPTPDNTFSANIGVVSDYRYRGISQSRVQPALQGGLDWSHKSGLYLGAWASSIKWLTDAPGGSGSVEWDIYGGYKKEVASDLTVDVGLLRYQYPNQNFSPSVNTTEVYGGVTYKVFTAKYSVATGNLFGYNDSINNRKSSGSGYLELSANFDLGNGYSLTPHVGHQWVRHYGVASFTDFSLTGTKDFGNGLSVFLTGVGTNANKGFYTSPVDGKFLGRAGVLIGAKYTYTF